MVRDANAPAGGAATTRMFYCDACPASYTHFDSLKRHRRGHEAARKGAPPRDKHTFACVVCGRVFATSLQRKSHLATTHCKVATQPDDKEAAPPPDSARKVAPPARARKMAPPSEASTNSAAGSSDSEEAATKTRHRDAAATRAAHRSPASTKAEWTCFVCKAVFPERRILNTHVYNNGHFPAMMATATMGVLITSHVPMATAAIDAVARGNHYLDERYDRPKSAGVYRNQVAPAAASPLTPQVTPPAFACGVCAGRAFDSWEALTVHMSLHTTCPINVIRVKREAGESDGDAPMAVGGGRFDTLYKCALCDEAFRTIEKYGVHMRTHHAQC
ncbi:PREDICTED: replication initiator 1-like [Priapulus caudatus]|uniref:Replication initiator 1-like n=1 Tax=Priapulus caudatus TaxID=37621 RepID=A0ABM1EVS2_PRICU|nr:PREDICTED: replication initiator 1-like [Priapulus caudatus]